MKEGLKPCPFCGGEAKMDNWSSTDGYMNDWWKRVQCTVCDIAKLGKTEEEVIEAWNTRKLPENNPLTLDEVMSLKENDVVWLETSDFIEPILIIDIQSSVIDFGFIINSHGGSHLDLSELAKEYFLYCNNPDHIADVSKKEEQK